MDLIDKKILCEIDVNCRTPMSKIGKNLRINRNVVDYRIKNLEKKGIITSYVTSVNLGKLGYKTYKIYFRIWSHKKSESEFVNELINNKQIIHFLKNEGRYDYSVSIAVKNIKELDEFLMDLKNKFRDLIKDYQVSILVHSRVFKLNKLLLNQKTMLKFDKYSSEEEKYEMDSKDVLILKTISQNANMPIIEIAEKTKLSLDVVKYRLKRLSKSLVNSFRMIPDVSKLGYYHYVILLRVRQATKQDEEKLLTWCSLKKNVLFATKRIGYHDFAINAAITSIEDLNGFIAEIKTEFGDMIDSYDVVINSKLLKLSYVPF